MKNDEHPYLEFEGTPLWKAVSRAVKLLEQNSDVQLLTRPEYVVGAICKMIASSDASIRRKRGANESKRKHTMSLRRRLN